MRIKDIRFQIFSYYYKKLLLRHLSDILTNLFVPLLLQLFDIVSHAKMMSKQLIHMQLITHLENYRSICQLLLDLLHDYYILTRQLYKTSLSLQLMARVFPLQPSQVEMQLNTLGACCLLSSATSLHTDSQAINVTITIMSL